MKKNIIQNRRITDDMHYTKEIENKNDGLIDWKRNKKSSKAELKLLFFNGILGFPYRNVLGVIETFEFPI